MNTKATRPAKLTLIFQLSDRLSPMRAWKILCDLKAWGSSFSPNTFRISGSPDGRFTGRLAEAIVVEALSQDKEVDLLRRERRTLSLILSSRPNPDGRRLYLRAPQPQTFERATVFLELMKSLYANVLPLWAVAGGTGHFNVENSGIPVGWATIFASQPGRGFRVTKLLMAPAYIIEILPDGGVLLVATPLPSDLGRGADRRSSALEVYLRAEGGVPFRPLHSNNPIQPFSE